MVLRSSKRLSAGRRPNRLASVTTRPLAYSEVSSDNLALASVSREALGQQGAVETGASRKPAGEGGGRGTALPPPQAAPPRGPSLPGPGEPAAGAEGPPPGTRRPLKARAAAAGRVAMATALPAAEAARRPDTRPDPLRGPARLLRPSAAGSATLLQSEFRGSEGAKAATAPLPPCGPASSLSRALSGRGPRCVPLTVAAPGPAAAAGRRRDAA
ncbi:unnamed protein product [Rangifer tarandus platyrhynchus]|uniref:Uncharacterized protein n=2 Tax=Rangifer tarandus platyrhynchus TaxID=3082113 RepID=A0ACB0ELN2_RANTA|nr:unnamed protein product [Rangifer tarandus platyrhynchus]CAI9701595.1 unnamed protein product [Rangifer tarandus platyrhynchus]